MHKTSSSKTEQKLMIERNRVTNLLFPFSLMRWRNRKRRKSTTHYALTVLGIKMVIPIADTAFIIEFLPAIYLFSIVKHAQAMHAMNSLFFHPTTTTEWGECELLRFVAKLRLICSAQSALDGVVEIKQQNTKEMKGKKHIIVKWMRREKKIAVLFRKSCLPLTHTAHAHSNRVNYSAEKSRVTRRAHSAMSSKSSPPRAVGDRSSIRTRNTNAFFFSCCFSHSAFFRCRLISVFFRGRWIR